MIELLCIMSLKARYRNGQIMMYHNLLKGICVFQKGHHNLLKGICVLEREMRIQRSRQVIFTRLLRMAASLHTVLNSSCKRSMH